MPRGSVPDRPRILILHYKLQAHGGASGVAGWALQALRDQFDVTLLADAPFDLDAVNRFFGTSLRPDDFRVRYIPPVMRALLNLDPDPCSVQKYCYMMRMAKRRVREFDCLFTTFNEADLGGSGIQYLHMAQFDHMQSRSVRHLDLPWGERWRALRQGKLRPWMAVGDFSFDRMCRNHTLVNSDWTGKWVKRVYGIDSVTVYPPAAGSFPSVTWQEREDGFLVLGRFHPWKRPAWIVGVLNKVRREFPHVRMHLIGGPDRIGGAESYYRTLLQAVEPHRDWIVMHENIPRIELENLMAENRYGMNAAMDEHFGMAVAEMVMAGCIPFVHNSGGQREIVGEEQRLLFDSEDEAVEKIIQVMRDSEAQAAIRDNLVKRRERFTPEAFMRGIKREIAQYVGL
jgi:glycosyltransferase involved in cell wall biosynthesis